MCSNNKNEQTSIKDVNQMKKIKNKASKETKRKGDRDTADFNQINYLPSNM